MPRHNEPSDPTTGTPTLSDPLDRERAIDTRQTGELLGWAPITLAQKRARGEGPPFFRIGRTIRYRLGDVLDWRDARAIGKRR